MNLIILLSCCVSLATLAVLLWRRSRPRERKIPSSYLGVVSQEAPERLRLSRPPWLPWTLVLLATLGAALAFWPPTRVGGPQGNRQAGLLWIDNTFSSYLALREGRMPPQQVASELVNMGMRLFALEETFTFAPGTGRVSYKIVELPDPGAVEAYVRRRAAALPSPFARPLALRELNHALLEHGEFADGRGVFVAVTDGQRQTLQNLSALKPRFARARAVLLPLAGALTGTRAEIVPSDLLPLWKEAASADADFSRVEEGATRIPAQARPGLFQESFALGDASFRMVTDARGGGSDQRGMPMITGCAAQLAGPLELDAFADLKAFAQFFRVPVRLERCKETRDENGAQGDRREDDPWKYRRRTVWVVPTDEEIYNTLTSRGELWIPAGFNPRVDSLVYTASYRLRFGDELLERRPVQLDAGTVPTVLMLMADPPATPLVLPEGLTSAPSHVPPDASGLPASRARPVAFDAGAARERQGFVFKPMFTSADNVTLGYRLDPVGPRDQSDREDRMAEEGPREQAAEAASDTGAPSSATATTPPFPSVFFLRTTTAMPNGELGRSSQWSRFWLEVGRAREGGIPSVLRREFVDVADLMRVQLEGKAFDVSALSAALDADSLKWRALGDGGEDQGTAGASGAVGTAGGDTVRGALPPAAGLYKIKDSPLMLHWSVPQAERSRSVFSTQELEGLFDNAQTASVAAQDEVKERSVRARALGGAVLACAALAFLWTSRAARTTLIMCIGVLGARTAIAPGSALGDVGTNARAARPDASSDARPDVRRVQQGNSGGLDPRNFFPRSFFRPQAARAPGPTTLPFRVAWCDAEVPPEVQSRYTQMRNLLASRGTIEMPEALLAGACRPGASEIWWTDTARALDPQLLSEHLSAGGAFVLEGQSSTDAYLQLSQAADASIGLTWEVPQKRGLLYRSFYLLQTFDGCPDDRTRLLTLRKKANAHSPVGVFTSARFLSQGTDCFSTDEDYRARSFVNMMYSILATDYKEDQLQLPEILNRVRNLGLEP